MVKNLSASAGAMGSIHESGRSLEEEVATHSNILDWKNPMDRGTWRATVHEVAKIWT